MQLVLYNRGRPNISIWNLYNISPTSWNRFFRENINHIAVAVFDASNCYWLSEELLLKTVIQMSNLKELYVHNTNISLVNLPVVFKACGKLVRLSFSLVKSSLDVYENSTGGESLEWMLLGFQRLTHLKIFTINFSIFDYLHETWLATLRVLR